MPSGRLKALAVSQIKKIYRQMTMIDQNDLLSIQGILRSITCERFHDIWELAKAGNTAELNSEDRKLARIMLQHREEYHNQFEFADVMAEHDFIPGQETNPFLHIILHQIIENQLEQRDPIQVYQFYLSMRKKNSDHHEAIHLVSIIFVHFLFDSLKDQKPFDNTGHVNTLIKLKDKKPEKIMAAMEMD